MATTNIWKQFETLLPKQSRTIATIISNNANGTSTAQLRNGTEIILSGESVQPGKKVITNGSEVSYEVPDIPVYNRYI
ncbi:hypothetical protein GCM10023116_04540 [Kistimonas scapharcae]|uniref:Uncharacterized protein n=1 Tax=Kistimonas scapharcae TaxID=1036133 RepID=A0ABP8UYC7_9GAMM